MCVWLSAHNIRSTHVKGLKFIGPIDGPDKPHWIMPSIWLTGGVVIKRQNDMVEVNPPCIMRSLSLKAGRMI